MKKAIGLLLVMIMCMCFPVTALAEQKTPSETGKIIIIHNGEKTVLDFRECVTIYDEDGNVVPFPPATRASYTPNVKLKPGKTLSFAYDFGYYGTLIDMYASCSAGNVSNLLAMGSCSSHPARTSIGYFTPTQGQWYGHASGYLPWEDTQTTFYVSNKGSETINVDSITLTF